MLPRTTPLTNDDRALRFTVGRCCAAEPAVLEEEECSYFVVFSVVCFVCEVLGIRKTARAKLQLAGVRVRSARQKNTEEEQRKLVGSS